MGTVPTSPENSVKELRKLCGARFVDQLKKFSFSQDFKGIVVVDSITELEARQVRPILNILRFSLFLLHDVRSPKSLLCYVCMMLSRAG